MMICRTAKQSAVCERDRMRGYRMKLRYGIALMVLTVVGFLALPALAMSSEKGCADDGSHYGMHFMLDNVTSEQLNNMTLAEIKELRQKQMEKMDNMTLAQIKELRKDKNETQYQGNDTRCHAPMGQDAKACGRDRMGGRDHGQGMQPAGERDHFGANAGHNNKMQDGQMMPHMMGFDTFMMMDNLSQEELNNMTIAEIRDLKQKKMQEMENMTLGQIKELQQKKMQERMDKLNNTTLGDLMKQGKGFFAMQGNDMAGRPEMQPAGMGR